MPINHSFLSDYTIGKLSYPKFDSGKIVLSGPIDIAYNNFSVNVNTDSSLQRLMNYHHLPVVYSSGGLIYNYNISFPIILTLSGNENELAVRENELKFWAAWIQYAVAGMDKICLFNQDGDLVDVCNVIVERASLSASYDSCNLELSIISNINLGWDVENKWISNNADKVLIGRRVKGYDLYVKYTSYLEMNTYQPSDNNEININEGDIICPNKGWNNIYGIISASINLSTNSGRIYTTKNNLNSPYVTTDIIYASTVDINGFIEVFGKQNMSSIPVTLQTSEYLNWSSFNDDVIYSNMYDGGLQVWIGHFVSDEEGTSVFNGRILSILPNNTFVYSAARTTGRTINERRNLYYIATQSPILPDKADPDQYKINR